MVFRPPKLRWLPLLAVAAVGAASFGGAKPVATNASQSIIFSSPDNSEVSSNNVSPSLQPPSSLNFQDRLQLFQDKSPVAVFDNPPVTAAPVPRPTVIRRVQNSSNERQEWEFMTPAEIMGVAPDQILQTEEHNANKRQGALTTLERYLQGKSPSAMYSSIGDVAPSSRHSQTNENDGMSDVISDWISSSPGDVQPAIFSPSPQNALAPNNNLFASPNKFTDPTGNSDWSKLFGSPLLLATSNPMKRQQPQTEEPQADINQFMQLLNFAPSPVAAWGSAPDGTTPLKTLKTQTGLSDFISTELLGNPIGASFIPLSSGINKPTGVAPLPTITRQANSQPGVRPAWAPQPPPWLSPMPQPFTIPQTKF